METSKYHTILESILTIYIKLRMKGDQDSTFDLQP